MAKWNKATFLTSAKGNCEPRVQAVILDLIRFAEQDADQVSWGRGEGYGTMTFKCKSIDYGFIPLFQITSNGKRYLVSNKLPISLIVLSFIGFSLICHFVLNMI